MTTKCLALPTFSTVSLVAGYYLAVVIWRNTRNQLSSIAHKFLSAGLFYHVLSSAGPFATAPLIVMGKAGTPLYFDVIYFFLHFQYNGFFTFVILAIIYKYLEAQNAGIKSGNLVFLLFNSACIPAYFLSILWHQPSLIFNVVGGVAAGLQVFALIFLIKDAVQIRWMHNYVRTLFALSLFAFTLKNIFQFMGAFPLIASISYEYRNLVIAYLHLVLLGFVSLFSFSAVLEFFTIRIADPIRWGVFLFLAAFVTTELLLAFSAAGNLWGFKIRAFSMNLLLFSCLFPVAFIILYTSIKKQISGFPSPFTNHPNPLNPPPKTLSP